MKIFCKDCGEQMTFVEGWDGTWETCVPYHSPVGHFHDDNCHTRTYRCKNKHKALVSIRRRCPSCNWVGKESCGCHPDRKVDEWPEEKEINSA